MSDNTATDQVDVMPKPPSGLSREAKALWRDVFDQFQIDSATKLIFVAEACRSLDRLRAAQRDIRKNGITTNGRYGQRVLNPAVGVERTSRAAFLSALKQIGFQGANYV